jgi:hypothetical protein
VASRAISDTNFAINLIADGSAMAAVTAVITYTAGAPPRSPAGQQASEP